jgi:hypothetical protein
MYNSAHSDEYSTDYLSWPEELPRICDLCRHPLKFAFADNGKIIQNLDGMVYQVMYWYTCENEKCDHYHHYFNPAPRYDFGTSYYGKDVLQRVAKELITFKQNPKQIQFRLKIDYEVEIDIRTVQRMCRDILLTKSHQIDQTTKDLIKKNAGIIIAADAQKPGQKYDGLWLFTDALSGRLLRTETRGSMTASELHDQIERIIIEFDTKLLGAISDKQNNLEKCFREYYPHIPHQFCTYHFIDHLWSHLEIFDGLLYHHLNKTVQELYIKTKSTAHPVFFEGLGLKSVQEVFAPIIQDLDKMCNLRNKKFERLHGLILYRNLKRYVLQIETKMENREPHLRIEKLLTRMLPDLKADLEELDAKFREDLYMFDMFQLIYKIMYAPIPFRAEKQERLDYLFGVIWAVAQSKDSTLILEQLSSIQPATSIPCSRILGEWTRLWNSYLPGLFSYYDFPKTIRTNVAQERAFSAEKMMLIHRMAKKEVGPMLVFQGELYLRLFHCDPTELSQDIIHDYTQTEISLLRKEYHEKTMKLMKEWTYLDQEFRGIDQVLALC